MHAGIQIERFLVLVVLVVGTTTTRAAEPPGTIGWLEQVAIPDANLVMHAKIDTGADNSSVNATDIRFVTRGGETWVQFGIKDGEGALIPMERPLLRIGQIKRKEGGYLERPVVLLDVCVAGRRLNAEVNLADRDHFNYPMLIGRSLMARQFLVDPDRTYLTQPGCA